jgi:hypothetical protein
METVTEGRGIVNSKEGLQKGEREEREVWIGCISHEKLYIIDSHIVIFKLKMA